MYTPIENTDSGIDNAKAELAIELSELKSQFDDAMRNGHQFDDARTLYHQMNELSSRINVMNWDGKSTETDQKNK